MSSIPTIRMDGSDRERTIQSLRSACEETGFFYLEGHGISPCDLEKVLQASKDLFALPLQCKQALSDPVMSRGYTAMEEETLDPANQSKGDTKEGFYIANDVPKTSPKYNPSKLSGPNQWPTSELCPGLDCDAWKATMTEYFEKASQVGFRLTQLLALAIGLDDEHYFDEHFTDPLAMIRLLHYKREKSNPAQGVFACGAHSDYGMLTLLLTDENSGLQILTKENTWVDVPPKKNSFVVNLGDMLERWTNNLFKSTVHRVITSGDTERYSIPFFYEPNFDTVVECLDVCCSEANPPKNPPTTSGQHLLDKYKQSHADYKPRR